MPKIFLYLVLFFVLFSSTCLQASSNPFSGYETLVSKIHKSSLAKRKEVLKETISKDGFWIKGSWGDTLWCLSALYLNEKVEEANKRLFDRATKYAQSMEKGSESKDFKPEKYKDDSPWGYFALVDYTRILCMFHSQSSHHPGRLKRETERAMKEALFQLVRYKSKVAEASLDQLLVHHGTENHDLVLRPQYYLVASVLKDDPIFKKRKYADGKTATDHYEAYNRFFRAWARKKAMVGLWWEMGSDTYMKYSWPSIFNLHELSPDPMVRSSLGKFLDLAFIEEAQISIKGRRGGGRSRAGYGKNSFETYKNLLYVQEGIGAGCSHSKVMETSTYQLPAEAILLRYMTFPTKEAFLIVNRVPGELAPSGKEFTSKDNSFNAYVEDSALINYAYRTPNYLLGSTLQNPSLSMKEDGKDVLKYSGISRQNRWSGMLFDDPTAGLGSLKHRYDNEMCAIFPEIEKTAGGRPQHPFWSFQHENVLFMQRITPGKGMGSYSTGAINLRFHGKKLSKVEKQGWIFASNGKAYVGVRFLDGGYSWDKGRELAKPMGYKGSQATRYLLHSGDVTSHPSFEAFQNDLLDNELNVDTGKVEYTFSKEGSKMEVFSYVVKNYKEFKLPLINGVPVNLRPEKTFSSPYLQSQFGDDKFHVSVGPLKRVIDFSDSL